MKTLQQLERHLGAYQWLDSEEINDWSARRAYYAKPDTYVYEEEESRISQGDWLVNSGTTIFLSKTISVPERFSGQPLGFVLEFGGRGEGLLSIDGVPYHGLDRNRPYIPLSAKSVRDGVICAHIELFNPMALPKDNLNPDQAADEETAPPPLYLQKCLLVVPNRAAESLRFTVQVYKNTASLLAEGDRRRDLILKALTAVVDQFLAAGPSHLRDQRWLTGLESSLRDSFGDLAMGFNEGHMHMVGQSHIDTAWLWPIKETIRKCSRTFSTACTLLDTYPNFIFSHSQPQQYEFVKKHHPALYERIKEQVAAGRWEIVGGMWVEPDLNIPSGESLVRQLLFGKRYFQQEFGQNPRIEWLPDTFGYCASLPQLLKKSGIDYFMTTKMNWNDTNPFPYDLFYWTGIDGTKVLSFLNHGLNEHTTPQDVSSHWASFKQKSAHPEQMLLYGHGDGGGGVTREMVEYVERSANLPGLPTAAFGRAHEFFDGIQAANPSLPEWVGDLYLELHRGTYTTHAKIKRFNRKAEVLFREAEIWNTFATLLGSQYPQESLTDGWKLILVNQFHDIIPGSSIHPVYVDAEAAYVGAFKLGRQALNQGLRSIEASVNTEGEDEPLLVFNSLGWARSAEVVLYGGSELHGTELIAADGTLLAADVVQVDDQYQLHAWVPSVPAMGYETLRRRVVDDGRQTLERVALNGVWETKFYVIEWNDNGEITRLFDKAHQREVVPSGKVANQLQLFHDRPLFWDAWDVDPQFESQPAGRAQLQSVDVVLKGTVKDILRFVWRLSESTIRQDLILHHHSRQIDFVNTVDWHEEHKLLKVAFPVDILSSKATFEIPFGSVERATHSNTTWEQAQFEVCGHRWVDLSDGGYGVSLMNDCKYGYDVKRNVLRLSLLRASKWPDPEADQGIHEFTYSLYPHGGDWREAHVVRHGYELNHPVEVLETTAHSGTLPASHSFVAFESQHVILDTLKRAEDSDDVIVRMYESAGGREQVSIQFQFPVESVQVTNLLEQPESQLTVANTGVSTGLSAFEVQTLKVLRG